MQCQTIKKDQECYFWGVEGCTYEGGQCQNVVEKCDGCSRPEDWPTGSYCSKYPSPDAQWRLGLCNMATHIKIETEEAQKINPLKASKRAGGRR